jgi:hypothetical protein
MSVLDQGLDLIAQARLVSFEHLPLLLEVNDDIAQPLGPMPLGVQILLQLLNCTSPVSVSPFITIHTWRNVLFCAVRKSTTIPPEARWPVAPFSSIKILRHGGEAMSAVTSSQTTKSRGGCTGNRAVCNGAGGGRS